MRSAKLGSKLFDKASTSSCPTVSAFLTIPRANPINAFTMGARCWVEHRRVQSAALSGPGVADGRRPGRLERNQGYWASVNGTFNARVWCSGSPSVVATTLSSDCRREPMMALP